MLWVGASFLLSSNVDGADETDEANAEKLAGSLEAGAHFLASDFHGPVTGRDHVAAIPAGTPARCNPVTAAPGCTPDAIEWLASP